MQSKVISEYCVMRRDTLDDGLRYHAYDLCELIPVEEFEQGVLEVDESAALAVLLANNVIFTNSLWWKTQWPDASRKLAGLFVECSDVFAWGCADGELCEFSDIPEVFSFWEKDPEYGHYVWCCKRRNQEPQHAMREVIEKSGIWDFKLLNLGHNRYEHAVERAINLRWLKKNAM